MIRNNAEWILTAHSFYTDEELSDGIVYVTAECSSCGRHHPDNYEVYSKRTGRPEWCGYDYNWKFDKVLEEHNALKESKKAFFSNFCPNCGAKMSVKEG
jgi:hypothetical protein